MKAKKRKARGRAGGRGQSVQLALEGLGHLSRVRLRVVELADLLGCSSRAVYRLLAAFRAAGLTVKSAKQGREVRHWIDRQDVSDLAGNLLRKR